MDISIEKVLSSYDRQIFRPDGDGNYRMEFLPEGKISRTITRKEFNAKHSFSFDESLRISPEYLPFSISGLSIDKPSPLVLEITNPTEEHLTLSSFVYVDGVFDFEISGIPVPPGKSKTRIQDDRLSHLFKPMTRRIHFMEIYLSKTAGTTVATGPDDEFLEFSISAYVPLEFEPGEGISFTYISDILSESGIIGAVGDIGLDIRRMEINASFANELPLDITVEPANTYDNGIIINMDKAIAAGTADHQATTDLTMKVLASKNLNNIDNVLFHISAVAPDSGSSAVRLTAGQKVTMNTANVTLPEGFTIF